MQETLETQGSIPQSGRSPGGGHGNPLQYSRLENPHGQRSLAGHSLQGQESDTTKVTLHAQMQDFFACGSSAPVRIEHEGGAAACLVGTLAASSVQGHRLPPP